MGQFGGIVMIMESRQHIVSFLVAGIISLSASSLAADTYRWKDKDGNLRYGSSIPAEYAEQPYDILNIWLYL